MNFHVMLTLTILLTVGLVPRKPVLTSADKSIQLRQAKACQSTGAEFRAQFLHLCDSTITKLKDENRKEPFFIDSYGIRGLCVAYDMTGNPKYLNACRSWSEQMVKFQERMIPAGAYYMNYGRKPGQKTGDWFVADCSSIAAGVLTTAVRCTGTERKRLFRSAERFASLVMRNYVRSAGGVTDGVWPQYNGAWWCSSSLFGSLSFILYSNTGGKRYLKAGLSVADWLNKLNLARVQPLPLSHQGPSMPMYVLEMYSAGWPYLSKDSARKESALAQISWCLKWTAGQQQKPITQREWELTGWWGAKYGGLPFHQYVFSHYLHSDNALSLAADREMRQLAPLAFSGKPETSQLAMFMMMSYAERLAPGAIYRAAEVTHSVGNRTSHRKAE